MASIALIVVCLGVILYNCYKYMVYKPKNFPPGPPRIPIFGSYLFLLLAKFQHMHRASEFWCNVYKTKILGLYYGKFIAVVVHDLEVIKDVLTNPDFDGRPIFLLAKVRDPKFDVFGIFFRDGNFWKDQRRFALRHLRDFGFGRRFNELEIHINEELLTFVDLMKNGPKYEYEKEIVKNNTALMPKILSGVPGNLFLKILLNERLSRKDLGLVYDASDYALSFSRTADMYGRMFSLIESWRYIFPNATGYNAVRKHSMDLYHVMLKMLQEQYATYDPNHERHFLDLYIKEMKTGENDSFSFDQLVHTMVDFILPALAAVSSQMTQTLQRLILNPDVMTKCQQEIDNVVGKGRLPTLDDRQHMSYTEATIRESMRLDTLTANGVPHLAIADTKMGGYDIPKGCLVITVLQVAHESDVHYIDPKIFNPTRFLDADGKLDLKLDTSLPFGAGKRLCAGETFARNTIFLFLATVLQNFNISVPEGSKLPHPALELQNTGTIKTPPDFWLKFESR